MRQDRAQCVVSSFKICHNVLLSACQKKVASQWKQTKRNCVFNNQKVPTAQFHPGRFGSKFSHIFKSDTKFELLYERRPKVNIHVKHSAKQCRIMDQSQILQPGPHFIITPTYMANFMSKIFFQQYKHQGWTKRTLKSISLISNCIFCEKKNYILYKIFVIFEVFSNSGA